MSDEMSDRIARGLAALAIPSAAVVEPPREGPRSEIDKRLEEIGQRFRAREWTLEYCNQRFARLFSDALALRSALSAAQRDSERVREDAEQMRYAGAQLANLACNLAQRDGPLSRHQRDSLRACQERWDSVVVSHCAAVSPSPEPE